MKQNLVSQDGEHQYVLGEGEGEGHWEHCLYQY